MRSRILRLAVMSVTAATSLVQFLGTAPLASGLDEPWERKPALSAAAAEVVRASTAIQAERDRPITALLEDFEIRYESDGRALKRYAYAFRVETDGEGWDTAEEMWAPWYQERPEFRARVVTAGGEERRLDPATVGEFSVDQEEPVVLGDRRRLRAPLPALGPGAVAEIEIVTQEVRSPFAAGDCRRVTVGGSYPIRRQRIVVDAPVDLPLKWSLRGYPGVEPTVTVESGRRRVELDLRSLPAFDAPEENLPSDLFDARRFAWSTVPSWAAAARGYAEIVDGALRGADLAPVVAKFTAGAKSREETIRRLVDGLQRQVRYTGVEFGEAELVPRPPAETLERGYGDCKDKAMLLVGLLRAAGIPAHVALLATGPGPDADPDLPGVRWFDHAIVFVPGEPALWIDATDRWGALGGLPLEDQGRRALVAAESTTALVETPVATPEQNRFVETRAFFLADPGKGRVVETTEVWGEWERTYRDDFDGVPEEKRRGHFADYARRTYEAEELGTLTITPTDDLSVPFKMELEALRSGKVVTTFVDAEIQINDWPVLSHLVEALEFDADDTAAALRKSDLVLPFPHQQILRYVITPPAGFAPGAVPESSQKGIGPATLTRRFETDLKGVVTATLSLDTGRRQWTLAEVAEGHAALRAVAGEPMFVVRFDQVGEAHLAAGRIKEALAEFRRLAAASPQSAGPLARESRALIEAGLGEAARVQAQRAISLDPGSARAQYALGSVLQHDAVGRQFGKGWDRAGALAAMRKAAEIEPDNAHMRANLAILLEFDADGERYTSGGQLDEAIREYRAIREELDVSDYDTNLLNALAHAGRFGELRALAAELEENADSRTWQLVAVAAEKGAPEAMAFAEKLATSPDDRNALLLAAGETLVPLRFYPVAAALLAAGAKGADDPQQLRARIELISRVRRAEETLFPTDDPRFPVAQLFLIAFGPAPRADQLSELFAEASVGPNEFSPGSEGLARLRGIRHGIANLGFSSEFIRDILMSVF